MPIPSVDELKRPTLVYLAQGVGDSDEIRTRLVRHFKLDKAEIDQRRRSPVSIFTNNHAWALVRLQQDKLIEKTGHGRYAITPTGRRVLEHGEAARYPISAPEPGKLPRWAKTLISRANKRNVELSIGSRLTEHDLLVLWKRCGGRCAITGLPFSDQRIGRGKAKRAFAPSIDRIDPDEGYRLDNCRLVMVAVNFALNAWGLEVYLGLARAAVANQERGST